ncbi:DUF4123 domain-containing protein [Thalassospira marina]|nr:DUF4123 domain-containing protein [Thalassospira marina]
MTAPELEPWLGHCHFVRDLSGDTDTEDGFGADTATVTETLTGVAAVWVDGRDAYETVLRAHLTAIGGDLSPLRLLWAEDVMPATEWMVRHAREKQALDLARNVYAQHPVELGLLASDATTTAEPVAWLDIKEIPGIEPLDGQFGVYPRKTVPDGLLEPLFGEVEPTAAEISFYDGLENVPPLKTYAVIDAGKLTGGASAIETCGMPWRCMFKGKAAVELGDVAPYLIELDRGANFTRILFTHDPNANAQATTRHLWHREPAIYIRSRADIDDLWKHFRRFTRIQDEMGKWYYLRFWEPEHLTKRLENVDFARKFLSFDGNGVLVCPTTKATYLIRKTETDMSGFSGPVTIDINVIENDLRRNWFERVAGNIVASFPEHALDLPKVRALTEISVNRMQSYGFISENHLTILASWEVFYGERYESKDPDGLLETICRSGAPAIRKFNAFRKRMESLSPDVMEAE